MSKPKHVYLIDGSGYIFRAFHALPPLSRSDGIQVNAVLGFTRLLATDAEHPLRETQQQRVAIVETAGAHLLALINDTLDLASIEAGT